MGPLAQLVAALWMICIGFLLAGYQMFSIVAGWSFSGLTLGGGIIMSVGGMLAAMFISSHLGR